MPNVTVILKSPIEGQTIDPVSGEGKIGQIREVILRIIDTDTANITVEPA